MMIDINDIKNGMTVIIDGNLYQIVEFLHVKPGKGAAFMKTKLKNLRTNSTLEKTFNTNIKIEKANITKKTMQYLYNAGGVYYFMDMQRNNFRRSKIFKRKLRSRISLFWIRINWFKFTRKNRLQSNIYNRCC